MIALTQTGKAWALVVFGSGFVLVVVGMSMSCLVAVQLGREVRNLSFVFLTFLMGMLGLCDCVDDLVGRFDPDRGHLLTALNVTMIPLLLCLPCLMWFVMQFAPSKLVMRRRLLAAAMLICGVGFVTIPAGHFRDSTRYLTDGTIRLDVKDASQVLVGVVGLLLSISFGLLLWERVKGRARGGLFWGLLFAHLGGMSFAVPVTYTYSVGANCWTLGILLLASPVLRQRLFDPRERMNRRLSLQTERLSLLLRIGREAGGSLQVDGFLSRVLDGIGAAFVFQSASVWLRDGEFFVLRAATGDGFGVKVTRQVRERVDWPLMMQRLRTLLTVTTQSDKGMVIDVRLPFYAGMDETPSSLMGMLSLEGLVLGGDVRDEVDGLRVLAGQIGLGLRTALSFEESERQRRLADEANAEKSRLFASLSHEVRTPIQAVLNLSGFIRQAVEAGSDRGSSDESLMDDILGLERSAHHLLALVNNILDFSRMEAGMIELRRQVTAVDPLVRSVQDTILPLLAEGVSLHFDLPDMLPDVFVDDLRIRQVLVNLGSNACKFCSAGSITFGAVVREHFVELSVRDTGVGIPFERQGLLFRRFEQGHVDVARSYGGSGLGLAICKQFVEMHDGHIWFESASGRGTVFRFTVPRADFVMGAGISTGDQELDDQSGRLFVPVDTRDLYRQVVISQALFDGSSGAFLSAGVKLLLVRDDDDALFFAQILRPDAVVLSVPRDTRALPGRTRVILGIVAQVADLGRSTRD